MVKNEDSCEMQKYSVLMTVYIKDDPKYFALSLESILNQTYPADEVVLVKDGAVSEELQSVIDNYIRKGMPIFQLQLEENVGLGLALNYGMKHCRNELVARMDSDDYSLPERCEMQVKEFEKNPKLDIIGCQADEFVGEIDNVVGSRKVPLTNAEIYKFAKLRDPFTHPTVMYRRSAVENAGGYSNYRKNQDTDLWVRMLKNGVFCMNLSVSVFRFRFDEGTFQKRKSWTNTRDLIKIRYNAWKDGFNTFGEFLAIVVSQLGVYLLPIKFQKWLYKKILRR